MADWTMRMWGMHRMGATLMGRGKRKGKKRLALAIDPLNHFFVRIADTDPRVLQRITR